MSSRFFSIGLIRREIASGVLSDMIQHPTRAEAEGLLPRLEPGCYISRSPEDVEKDKIRRDDARA